MKEKVYINIKGLQLAAQNVPRDYEEDDKKYMFVGSFNGIYVTELTADGLSVKRDADGT